MLELLKSRCGSKEQPPASPQHQQQQAVIVGELADMAVDIKQP